MLGACWERFYRKNVLKAHLQHCQGPQLGTVRSSKLPPESKQFPAEVENDEELTVTENSSSDQEYENQPRVMQTLHKSQKSLYPDLEFPSYLRTSEIRIPIKNHDHLITEDKQTSSTQAQPM